MQEIRSLTGLRGVAALLVVVYHLVNALYPAMGRAPHWHSKLYLCVDVFFVLSGFVVMLNYHALFASTPSAGAVMAFMVRRLARLYPLYLVVFVTFAALRIAEVYVTGAAPAVPLTWKVLLANLLMVQTWGISLSVVTTSWSISTEMAAYLLFPLLAGLVARGSRGTLVVLGCCAALALVGVQAAAWYLGLTRTPGIDVIHPDYGLPVLRCVAGFVTGMLVYRAYAGGIGERWTGHDRVGGLVCLGLAAGLLCGLPDLALYPLFPAVVLVLAVNQGRLAGLFGNPLLHRLGLWSYALYLTHHGALQRIPVALHAKLGGLMPEPAAAAVAALVYIAVALAVAAACFALIEVPGRQAVRQFWARAAMAMQSTPAWLRRAPLSQS